MTDIFFIADYTTDEYQAGAEMVDENIYKALGIPVIKSKDLLGINPNARYLLSNATLLHPEVKRELVANGTYWIMEHDYKCHQTRQPHLYPGCIFPQPERINLDYYRNARAVFTQSTDHTNCLTANEVVANFINLSTSIWSDQELRDLAMLSHEPKVSFKTAIIDDPGPHKGTKETIEICKKNNIAFELIPKLPRTEFYEKLSRYAMLAYFPNVKESFCRLVVEARCMQMNVFTLPWYGATKEPWFHMYGRPLIDFLRERTKQNLDLIRVCLDND